VERREQRNDGALGIADHGETPDVREILARHEDRSAPAAPPRPLSRQRHRRPQIQFSKPASELPQVS
jgi:hypothetical protein